MALEEAQNGIEAGEGGPFGAVIVKNSEVIATGHNMVVKTNDPTAHAEMVAIRKASRKLGTFHLEGCTLYVTAEPCPMCFSAIHWAHIERVVYCNTKADSAAIGFDDTLISDIIAGRVEDTVRFEHRPSPECRELFMEWYRDPNRVLY
ncbi:guanine deaminase [Hydrogenimonas sp.]|nr:guanine deaminase [Hydrogenimonas sp.]